jgi:hypothetical protein
MYCSHGEIPEPIGQSQSSNSPLKIGKSRVRENMFENLRKFQSPCKLISEILQ